jgi:hypothetical protein
MKKIIILILCLCSLFTLFACDETNESEVEPNHIKIMLGAVAKDKTGETKLVEISKEDGATLKYAEIQVLKKGEFETKFNDRFGYSYKDALNGGNDEKAKAAADRKTLLDEAFDNALENFKTALSTHGAEITAVDGESVIFIYDSDSIIESHGYIFGALVYVTEDEAKALRSDDAVDSVSEWRTAFFYNGVYKCYELYEIE